MSRLTTCFVVVCILVGCQPSDPLSDAGPEAGNPADTGASSDVGGEWVDAGLRDGASPTDVEAAIDAGPHRCGDGRVRPDRHPTDGDFEECDDGNDNAQDLCTNACRFRVVDMVALNYSTCALLANGRVYCRGYSSDRTLGLGDQQRPRFIDGWRRPRGLTDVAQIDGGRDWICARHHDQTVSCWGTSSYSRSGNGDTTLPQPRLMPEISGAEDLVLGTHSACYSNSSGQLLCWGRNRYGELGDGTTEQRGVPVVVQGLDPVIAFDLETYHACAVVQGGAVWCWGLSSSWRMASAELTGNQLQPVRIEGIEGAVDVTVSTYGGCARLGSGELLCWGSNWSGQTGVPRGSSIGPTALESLSQVSDVVMESTAGCAIAGEDDQVSCWGFNHLGQTGDPSTKHTDDGHRPLQGLTGAIGLALGPMHGCTWRADGRRFCWGSNSFGQLGTAEEAPLVIRRPRKVEGVQGLVQISAGDNHFCGLDQQGAAYCWGSNSYGQLGDGSTTAVNQPQLVDSIGPARQISAGQYFTCAVLIDGTAKCWGYNRNGQLGIGTWDDQNTPTLLALPPMQTIRAGNAFACGLDQTGTMHCWGYGSEGVLGQGNRTSRNVPFVVSNLPSIQDFSVSYRHVCAVTGSGSVYCWGRNNEGQTSESNSVTRVTLPFQVMVADAVSISVGRRHSCVLSSSEGAWCWGSNSSGQLGLGGSSSIEAPSRLGGLAAITSISAWKFGYGTCATIDRRLGGQGVYCWGSGFWGQVGDGSFSSRTSPVLIDVESALGDRLQMVAANDRQICALGQNGDLACWGDPTQGRTGHGTIDPLHLAPAEVVPFNR